MSGKACRLGHGADGPSRRAWCGLDPSGPGAVGGADSAALRAVRSCAGSRCSRGRARRETEAGPLRGDNPHAAGALRRTSGRPRG